MKEQILIALKKIEEEHNVTILYACESGSRAWGFPSQDSDFDVRFVYVHRRDWYLSIDDHKDTITDVGKVLDFSGWELRKTLKLFRGVNSSFLEKLQSPVIYREEVGFREELWKIAPLYYKPVAGIYHYLTQAHKIMEDELRTEQVKLKRYFYVIRGVLAVKWIQEYDEIPPMQLKDLRAVLKNEEISTWIDAMLVLKSKGNECLLVDRDEALNNYLEKALEDGKGYAKTLLPKAKQSSDKMNEILRKWILT